MREEEEPAGPPGGLLGGGDQLLRCAWAGPHEDYRAYHDTEWGRPQGDEHRLFEKLVLEGFQSGLSWLTILRKRENFRRAFCGFDYRRIAAFDSGTVDRLLGDAGIIRHRGKIEAAIGNAARAIEVAREHGSLAAYLWRFAPAPADRQDRCDHASLQARTTSPEAIALSRDLRRRGWRFVGPTTVYAFMQAVGMVNDHVGGCWCREAVEAEQRAFRRP
jgi:DNA-3-methyladenine glycosylase I